MGGGRADRRMLFDDVNGGDSLGEGRLRGGGLTVIQLFIEPGGLAGALAQEVKPAAANVARTNDLDLLDPGGMQQQRPFYADAVGNLAHRETAREAMAAQPDDRAFERLK